MTRTAPPFPTLPRLRLVLSGTAAFNLRTMSCGVHICWVSVETAVAFLSWQPNLPSAVTDRSGLGWCSLPTSASEQVFSPSVSFPMYPLPCFSACSVCCFTWELVFFSLSQGKFTFGLLSVISNLTGVLFFSLVVFVLFCVSPSSSFLVCSFSKSPF